MKTLTIKTYLFVLTFGLILLISAIALFITLPAIERIARANANIAEVRADIDRAAARAGAPEKTQKELSGVMEMVKQFSAARVPKGRHLEMIAAFETIAEQYRLAQKLSIDAGNGSAYHISVSARGAFSDHVAYLHALERLPYYVTIKKIDWTRDRTDPNTVNAVFDATIYAEDAPQ